MYARASARACMRVHMLTCTRVNACADTSSATAWAVSLGAAVGCAGLECLVLSSAGTHACVGTHTNTRTDAWILHICMHARKHALMQTGRRRRALLVRSIGRWRKRNLTAAYVDWLDSTIVRRTRRCDVVPDLGPT